MKFRILSLSLVLAGAAFLFSAPAQAIVEVRAGYGLHTPDDQVGAEKESLSGLTADIMVKPPMMPLAFGLRYELESNDTSAGELEHSRASVQLAYTALDLVLFHLDLVGGIGLTEKVELGPLKFDDGRTFNVGALGSVGLGLISLNAELGYQFGKLKGDLGGEAKMDGVYTKFLLGFGF